MNMPAFARPRRRCLSAPVWVLALVGLCVAVAGVNLAYSQARQRVPDLRGVWVGGVYGCGFLNAWARVNEPACGGDDTIDATITLQRNRMFAGSGGDPEDKLTGVLEQDGTVRLQIFDPDKPEMTTGVGKLTVEGGHLVIRATVHIVQDWDQLAEPILATGEMVLRKQ